MPGTGKYTDEEVRKILDRALRGEPEGVTHEELVEIASEVGLSPNDSRHLLDGAILVPAIGPAGVAPV